MLKIMSVVPLFSFLILAHSTASLAVVFEIRQRGTEKVIIKRDSKGSLQQFYIDADFLDNDEIFGLICKLEVADLPTFEEVGIRKKISSVLSERQLLDLLGSFDHTLIVNDNFPQSQKGKNEETRNEDEPVLRKSVFTEQAGTVRTNIENDHYVNEGWTDGLCFDSPIDYLSMIHNTFESIGIIDQVLEQPDRVDNNQSLTPEIKGLSAQRNDTAETAVSLNPQSSECENEIVAQVGSNRSPNALNLQKNKKKLSDFFSMRKELKGGAPDLELFLDLKFDVKILEERMKFRDKLVKTLIKNLSALKQDPGVDLNAKVSKLFTDTRIALIKNWRASKQKRYVSDRPDRNRDNALKPERNLALTSVQSTPDQMNLAKNKKLLSKCLIDIGFKLDDPYYQNLDKYLKLDREVMTVEERSDLRNRLVKSIKENLVSLSDLSGEALKTKVSQVLVNLKEGLMDKRRALQEKSWIKNYNDQKRSKTTPASLPNEQNLRDNEAKVSAQLGESQITLDDQVLKSVLKLLALSRDVRTYEARIEARNDLTRDFVESIANFDESKGESLLEVLTEKKKAFLNKRKNKLIDDKNYRNNIKNRIKENEAKLY